MRIKVSCLGILDAPTGPWAAIAADVRLGRGATAQSARYVLLSYDLRAALSAFFRGFRGGRDYSEVFRTLGGVDFLPRLVRSHAWDAAGNVTDDVPIHSRTGGWHSAEALWVRVDHAAVVLADFATWREANAPRAGGIWAPSWGVLQAVQAIALASGAAVPGETEAPAAVAGVR
jgi:hypothetical protein